MTTPAGGEISPQRPTVNNSEILFIYEAKLCNPNGDPDDENRPRIDPRTRVNLVSDVRLKRFIRNYLFKRFGWEYVWVSTVDHEHVDATTKLEKHMEKSAKQASRKEVDREDIIKSVFHRCLDARLFGAVFPLKGKEEEAKGRSIPFTGPVQFSWGYSLHPVEVVDSATITSVFKGRETTAEAGTIGKDWRVYYSLIAFYGVISGLRARDTELRPQDIQLLDNLIWDGVSLDATTRSKIGHKPHVYLRIEHQEDKLIGDLRRYIDVNYDPNKPIRSFQDLKLDFSRLVARLSGFKVKCFLRESDEAEGLLGGLLKDAENLPHNIEVNERVLVLSQ